MHIWKVLPVICGHRENKSADVWEYKDPAASPAPIFLYERVLKCCYFKTLQMVKPFGILIIVFHVLLCPPGHGCYYILIKVLTQQELWGIFKDTKRILQQNCGGRLYAKRRIMS